MRLTHVYISWTSAIVSMPKTEGTLQMMITEDMLLVICAIDKMFVFAYQTLLPCTDIVMVKCSC